MRRALMPFPAKAPDETKLVTFDFTKETAADATLSAPALVVSVKKQNATGTAAFGDITASNLNVPVGTKTAQVLIAGGLDGATYRLSCEVDASNSEHHRIDKDLPVKETAAVV